MPRKTSAKAALLPASENLPRRVLLDWIGRTPTPEQRTLIRTLLDAALQTRTGQGLRLSPEQQAPLDWTGRPAPGEPDVLAVTGGIQSGKSTVLAVDYVQRAPWLGGMPGWLVGPDYSQTRHERAMLTEYLAALEWLDWEASLLPKATNEPWVLRTIFGGSVTGLSSSKPETLAGESPGWIGVAEAGQCTQETANTVRARATARAARLVYAGTIERSQPWFVRLARRWQGANAEGGRAFTLPSWANPAFYPDGRHDAKIRAAERDLPPDVFLHRHAGVPAPPEGLVFREFNALQHGVTVRWGDRPPDADPWQLWLPRDLPVELAIDPGFLGSAYAVLALAEYGGQVVVFDEVHVRGMVHQQVIAVCQQRPWWPQVGTHPDRLGQGGVIDVAGTQHAMGGEPAVNVWAARPAAGGAGLRLRYQRVPLWQGTDRLHFALRPDAATDLALLVVDTDHCPRLVWELTEGYRYRTDTAGEILGETPHDRHNDAVKALSYWLYDRFGPLGESRGVKHGTGARMLLPWEVPA